MQCISCQFENMPGVRICGRCGSPLGLNEMAIDVHPPRAGAWRKRMRRWLPPGLFRPRRIFPHAADAAGRRGSEEPGESVPFAVLVRLVVPGWAHLHQRESARGWLFLGPYLGLLLLSLVLLGSYPGSLCLGLAFGIHVAACVSVLPLGGVEPRRLFLRTAVVAGVLVLAVYLPAGWLLSLAAQPATVGVNSPPFRVGDVVLSSSLVFSTRSPRPGDVVLYHQRRFYRSVNEGRDHVNVLVGAGDRIDRILAGPGDEVSFADGQLQVNGAPCRWRPLNLERWWRPLRLQVPAGHYCILPTTGEPIPDRVPAAVWPEVLRQLTLVSIQDIRGRAYLRSYPPLRMKWLF